MAKYRETGGHGHLPTACRRSQSADFRPSRPKIPCADIRETFRGELRNQIRVSQLTANEISLSLVLAGRHRPPQFGGGCAGGSAAGPVPPRLTNCVSARVAWCSRCGAPSRPSGIRPGQEISAPGSHEPFDATPRGHVDQTCPAMQARLTRWTLVLMAVIAAIGARHWLQL